MRSDFPFKTFLLLWVSHFCVDFCIGIWPIYKTLAGIDIAVAGLIMGIAGFTGEILQLLFGFFSDIGHRKKILIFGLLLASSILLVSFSSSFFGLLALMLGLMVGSGSYHPAAVGVASRLFPQKGRSILFFTTGGALGLGLSQVVFSKSLKWFDGHSYPLLIPVLIVAGFWIFHRLPERFLTRKSASLKDFSTPFLHNRKALLLLYLAQVCSYGVLLAVIFMLPDILKLKESSKWLFLGGGHMSFILGAFVGMFLLSAISDRWGYKKTLLINATLAMMLLLFFLFLPITSTLFTVILLGLIGTTLYLMNPMIIAWGNHLVPENPSTVSALMMGCAWCLSSLFPALAGLLASHIPYIAALGIVSLFLLASIIFVYLAPSPATEEPVVSEILQ